MWMLSMYSKVIWLKVVGDTKAVKINFLTRAQVIQTWGRVYLVPNMAKAREPTALGCGQDTKASPFLGDVELLWEPTTSQRPADSFAEPSYITQGSRSWPPDSFLSLLHCGSNWYQSPHLTSIFYRLFGLSGLLVIWLEPDGLSDSNQQGHSTARELYLIFFNNS